MADTNETTNVNTNANINTTANTAPAAGASKSAAPVRSNVVQRPGVNVLPGDNSSHPLNVAEQERKDTAEAERAQLIGGGLSEATVAEMEAGKKALGRNKPRD